MSGGTANKVVTRVKDTASSASPRRMVAFVKWGVWDKTNLAQRTFNKLNTKRKIRAASYTKVLPIDELRLHLDYLKLTAQFQEALARAFNEAMTNLGKLEMVQDTGHGQEMLTHAQFHFQNITDMQQRVKDAHDLEVRLARASGKGQQADDKLLVDFERFNLDCLNDSERFVGQLTESKAVCVAAIEFEAVKAWVAEHPDKAHENLVKGLKAADQGVNAVSTAGGIVGLVPQEEAKAASMALNIAGSCFEAGKAVLDKVILARDAARQVDNYQRENRPGAIFEELNRDPTLVPKLLAKKRVAEAKLALTLSKPIIVTAAQFVPMLPPGFGLDDLWGDICEGVLELVVEYQDERLRLAQEIVDGAKEEGGKKVLTKEQEENMFAAFGRDMLNDMGDRIKDNVFSVLQPHLVVRASIAHQISQRFAHAVVGKLNPDPAQLVDGDTLQAHINSIQGNVSAFLADYMQEITYDQAVGERPVDEEAPTKDKLGRAVVDSDGRPKAAPKGKHRVCIEIKGKRIWGYLRSEEDSFEPEMPDESAFEVWHDRVIEKEGYHLTGDGRMTLGTWYKPWPAKNYYLFEVGRGSRHEWARGSSQTANGPGTDYMMSAVLEHMSLGTQGYDLNKA